MCPVLDDGPDQTLGPTPRGAKHFSFLKEAYMLRKGIVLSAFAVAALALFTQSSYRYFEEGDKEVNLSGSAANSADFDVFVAAANGSLGYFITDNLEIGVRQS